MGGPLTARRDDRKLERLGRQIVEPTQRTFQTRERANAVCPEKGDFINRLEALRIEWREGYRFCGLVPRSV